MIADLLANPAVQIPLRAIAILPIVLVGTGVELYALMKVHSHIMSRVGPMYPGRFHGIGYPIAELLKWIQKEDIIPSRADRRVFILAPLLALVSSIMLFAVIPLGPGLVAARIDLGLFYVLALSSVSAIAVVMAAYSSSSKFTLIGGLRAVGQIIAYELPVVLGALAIAMLSGSLSLTRIVEAQSSWFIAVPFPFGFIAFAMFLISSLAEVMWAPFDMPMAESEIIAGPLTEYSGMRYIFFMIAEFAHSIALAAIGAVLFFGGWRGPPLVERFLPPFAWMLGKTLILVIVFIWVRFTLPRLREDQLQKLAWKLFIPLGLANVLGIAIFRVLT